MRTRQLIEEEPQEALLEAVRDIQALAGITDRRRDGADQAPFAIGVTSPSYGDGKTTLAMALAGSLSRDLGREVTLVDADFRTRSIEGEYGINRGDGLAEVLLGRVPLDAVTHHLPMTSLSVIPAGMALDDSDRLARSEHAAAFVANMKATSSYVVFDLPAALHSSTTAVLAQLCDGVIVVVKNGVTSRLDLERTLRRLDNANVLGVVINQWSSRIPNWVQRSLGLKL